MAASRRPRKQWHKLSPRSRARAERIAAEHYGLTRKQARERFNRGTFRPFAKAKEDRAPKNAPVYPVSLGKDLKAAAIANMDKHLGGPYEPYNRTNVIYAIEHHATDDALRRMAGASEDELRSWASAQTRTHKGGKGSAERTPQWLANLGWYSGEKWNNIFWYH